MTIVAIGDIHAHGDQLDALLANLKSGGITPATARFVFLGDYIDGGPDAKRVIEALMAMREDAPQTVCLKGNHEDLLLDALVHDGRRYQCFDLWWHQGGKETTESYRRDIDATPYERSMMQPLDIIPRAHLDWMDALPTMHETARFYFVHAGFIPNQPPEETDEYNRLWIRGRFINSDYDWGKRVVFGHTFHWVPYEDDHKIGIDTMQHHDGTLTAVILDDDTGALEYVRA